VLFDILGSGVKGGVGNIRCDYVGVVEVPGDCYGDAAAAGAQVADELPADACSQEFDGTLDEQFRLRPGNHTIGANIKLKRIEFGFSD